MAGQNVEGSNSQMPEILRTENWALDDQHQYSVPIFGTENWASDDQHQYPVPIFYDPNDLQNFVPGFDQLSNSIESSTSLDSNKRKNSGGRPRTIFTLEKLLECKGCTLEAAAKKLNASKSTVKRRVVELTGKSWLQFQQSLPDSQRPRENEKMQDEDNRVVIIVDWDGTRKPFDLTETKKPRRFQELEKHIQRGFQLEPKTYQVKCFYGGEDLTVSNSDTLQGCLTLAGNFNPLKLKVEVSAAAAEASMQ